MLEAGENDKTYKDKQTHHLKRLARVQIKTIIQKKFIQMISKRPVAKGKGKN